MACLKNSLSRTPPCGPAATFSIMSFTLANLARRAHLEIVYEYFHGQYWKALGLPDNSANCPPTLMISRSIERRRRNELTKKGTSRKTALGAVFANVYNLLSRLERTRLLRTTAFIFAFRLAVVRTEGGVSKILWEKGNSIARTGSSCTKGRPTIFASGHRALILCTMAAMVASSPRFPPAV